MINANELRIGNMVLVKDRYVLVESISDSGINIEAVGGYYAGEASTECEAYFNNWGSGNKYVEPIPLTPEILEKCGFEKDYDGFYCIDIGRKWFSVSVDEWASICFKSDIGLNAINLNSDIEYLHQLQNLIYALTCTELEIKF